jgi:aspartyl-tRNA(Asn)/glutamyl-tRNA(Gln) amidotransferase subunit B
VDERGQTVSQRSKEYAHDYRYFPEPDLPPLALDRKWVEEIRARLPELPEARRNRFMAEYGLSAYDANLLTGSRAMAEYFEACLKTGKPAGLALANHAKMVSNWLLSEFSRLLNATNADVSAIKVSPEQLCQLLDLMHRGSISGLVAKQVWEEMFDTGKSADEIVARKGLSQISNASELENTVERVLAENPQAVADFKAGKEAALKFLVGQLMRVTKGRANPQVANQLLKKKLEAK